MTQKVEMFVVQRELAEPKDYPPDGVWETSKEIHGSEFEAESEIAAERARASYVDSDSNVFRIVKLVGEVVRVDQPPEEE